MTENNRFMLDDAGTLIDMQTRDMFDIVEEVCPLLNILADENEELKSKLEYEKRQHQHWKKECLENIKEIAQLKREIIRLEMIIKTGEKKDEHLAWKRVDVE